MNDIFSKEFNDNINDYFDKILDETEKNLQSDKIADRMYTNSLLVEYLGLLGRTTEEDYSDVVPVSFELLDDSTKVKILNECLKEGIVIEKAKLYNYSLEGDFDIDIDIDINNDRSR